MLPLPNHHDNPFPFFYVDSAFSEQQCAVLEGLFLLAAKWQHRDGEFYRCSLCDVTEHVPVTFKTEVLVRMRGITQLPLVDRVTATTQRMLPGQAIGVHSDRPLIGYEIARLVVQLNKQWRPEHGGVLQLYSAPDSEVVFSVTPDYNKAFGFLLHADSYHAVTAVTRPRQTVVFNFWHKANTPELAEHLQTLFGNARFSELPTSLNTVAMTAELSLPEDTTFRAGTAALALLRWGYDEPTIVAGYQYSAGLSVCTSRNAETYAAILLADWVAFLYRDSFDLARWMLLRQQLEGTAMFARLMPCWQLCLPE